MIQPAYRGRRVLVTGDTGFKGKWLVQALTNLGAIVRGFSNNAEGRDHGDVRDIAAIENAMKWHAPDFVFHLAAQASVPIGYNAPRYTFETNALGTMNLLEALRRRNVPCSVVIVTTDKVYGESRSPFPCDEMFPLQGRCPYSASKVAAEYAVQAYRESFFGDGRIAVATARAGNVLGGGDWGVGRLIPNAIRALREGRPIPVYSPDSIRPWQFVDDVIDGYLLLGARLAENPSSTVGAWNFGPADHSQPFTVVDVVERVIEAWGSGSWEIVPTTLHEVKTLRIDSFKARRVLGWQPKWSLDDAIKATIKWYRENP